MTKKTLHKNYRMSKQRERILELLRSTDSHPTADWLYERLKSEFPRLSLGTVYRNLSVLIDQGFVKKIDFGSTFDRFEAKVAPHYHLVCERCGRVKDFEMSVYGDLNEQANALTEFNIKHHRIEFFGICSECSQKGVE